MSIRFTCTKCSRSIVVHDRFADRNVRCPGCDFELIVPKASKSGKSNLGTPLPSELQDEPIEVETVSDQPEKPPKKTNPSKISASKTEIQTNVEAGSIDSPITPPKRKARSIRSHDKGHEEDLEWDITPMVDVAFLLLIFFMLTASFSIQRVIRTTSPQTNEASTRVQTKNDTEESIIIQVDEFNAYTVVTSDGISNDASSKQELITILTDMREQLGLQSSRVVVQAHVDSNHGAVVACLDAAREAEFSKFQVIGVEEF